MTARCALGWRAGGRVGGHSVDPVETTGTAGTLTCIDNGNLQGSANPWMTTFEGVLLHVRFLPEEEPKLTFVPFEKQGNRQRAMKVSEPDRARWADLAGGSSKANPVGYEVVYWYETTQ